ncbi:hypothetical protein ACHWQZ_G014576 [Mnemiopsis leidyi]
MPYVNMSPGDAVRKEMTAKEGGQVETVGYDFTCLGSENNLDQCKGQRVVCHDKIVVKCSRPGISGICKSPCGCMAPTLLAKVVGGLDALPGEFPWQVSLSLGKYICGGTIIDSEHILTAAHCLHQPGAKHVPCKAQKSSAGDELPECYWVNDIKVYYGSSEWFSSENSNAEEAIVQKVFIHKDYVRGRQALYHDVAVIRLKSPIKLNPYVQPVCLPRDDFVLPPDKNVTVSGFGDTSRFSGIYPDTLQKASLNWLQLEECNKVMFGFLSDEHFCAGDTSGRVDACRGDSGGPLVYKNERGIATLVGVVSFSYGCAVPGLWSVYADVRKERDFIYSVLTDTPDKNTIILSCHLKNKRCKRI